MKGYTLDIRMDSWSGGGWNWKMETMEINEKINKMTLLLEGGRGIRYSCTADRNTKCHRLPRK